MPDQSPTFQSSPASKLRSQCIPPSYQSPFRYTRLSPLRKILVWTVMAIARAGINSQGGALLLGRLPQTEPAFVGSHSREQSCSGPQFKRRRQAVRTRIRSTKTHPLHPTTPVRRAPSGRPSGSTKTSASQHFGLGCLAARQGRTGR
jgi:hypothetical protein